MALLLNIDTATEHASVCLSDNNGVLLLLESNDQKNHGAFLQPAIQQLMQQTGLTLQQLDAIAVTEGPGSYTGLRVGLASSKGLCYALQKPLITINTLQVMAKAAIQEQGNQFPGALFCPLIDARRMEVFTAIYDGQLVEIEAPNAKILDASSFEDVLAKQPVVFNGTGNIKLKTVLNNKNAIFSAVQHNAATLSQLSSIAFENQSFANLAYCEPYYLKAFFSPAPKKIG